MNPIITHGAAAFGGLVIGLSGGLLWAHEHQQVKIVKEHDKAVQEARISEDKAQSVTSSVSTSAESKVADTRIVYRTITEKVPEYVTVKADSACVVPVGFVRLHDDAATGRLSEVSAPSGKSDDAASGLALSTVASTVASNYGTCREDQIRLAALQEWVNSQARIQEK